MISFIRLFCFFFFSPFLYRPTNGSPFRSMCVRLLSCLVFSLPSQLFFSSLFYVLNPAPLTLPVSFPLSSSIFHSLSLRLSWGTIYIRAQQSPAPLVAMATGLITASTLSPSFLYPPTLVLHLSLSLPPLSFPLHPLEVVL